MPAPSKGDVLAGVTVALLLIPQSLGLATIAGLPPEQGIYAAALAPLVTAFTSSSPYLQAGPTAMTSLLTLGALTAVAVPFTPGYVKLAALLALVVGVTRIAIGALRGGTVSYLMSQPVVAGFTAAAGILIVCSQVPAMLGVPGDPGSPVGSAVEALTHPGAWELSAVAMSAAAFALILGGRLLHPLFPGVLLATIGAIVVSEAVGYTGATVGDIPSGFPPLSADLPWGSIGSLLIPGAVIALVGFAEPAAIARHYATQERGLWDPNREFVSQGLANIATGLGSAYPVGGSFSRSALNKLAGAQTRWSSVVVALAVLAFLPFMGALAPLPTAVLAATVVAAVLSLLDPRPLVEFYRLARVQFLVAAGTFVATLATAPHVERGVIVGIVLAVVAHLWREIRLNVQTWVEDATLHVHPRGVLYYASAPSLEDTVGRLLHEHKDATRLVVHLDGLGRIDLTGALSLRDLLADAKEAGLEVRVVDVPLQAAKVVERTLTDDVPVTFLDQRLI
ncbi:MAG TPA: SulP family inorganic anion transporter [Actinomycetota bacterium]